MGESVCVCVDPIQKTKNFHLPIFSKLAQQRFSNIKRAKKKTTTERKERKEQISETSFLPPFPFFNSVSGLNQALWRRRRRRNSLSQTW